VSWILIAISAYLIFAVVSIGDKFVLKEAIPNSRVYAFLISSMGLFVLVAAPWFLHWPGIYWLAIDLLAGAFFTFALLFQYRALRRGDVSKVMVMIGGFIPVFTTIGSILFLGDHFFAYQWLGLESLVTGTFVIAWTVKEHKLSKTTLWGFAFSLFAALAYAAFFLVSKYAYNHQDFWSSFIWIRIGSALAGVFLLARATERKAIRALLHQKIGGHDKGNRKKIKGISGFLVLANQTLGAIASILQNYALSFGSVAIINALQGVQYAFLLVLSWLLAIFWPKIFYEAPGQDTLFKKVMALIFIMIGLYLII
jgi:uncharacterized membrane protein